MSVAGRPSEGAAARPRLLHNLPRIQAAQQPQPPGGAVGAAHGAAGLGADADAVPPRLLQRDAHSLHSLAAVQLKQELAGRSDTKKKRDWREESSKQVDGWMVDGPSLLPAARGAP